MVETHPLSPLPGEQVFRAPQALRDVCKVKLAELGNDGGEFAKAFADHVAGGEPIGLSMVEKLFDFIEQSLGDEEIRKRGGRTLEASVALMGGDVAQTWARGILAKAGKIAPPREGERHEFTAEVLKVDETLGLVFGWAIVCTEKGVPYYDTQDDHIPEASMLKAAADFMAHSRMLGDMHQKAEGGNVVFAFPMTADIAAAFGITTKTTGLMIGVKPASDETLEKFKSGEYSGFSIGGRRLIDEEVD